MCSTLDNQTRMFNCTSPHIHLSLCGCFAILLLNWYFILNITTVFENIRLFADQLIILQISSHVTGGGGGGGCQFTKLLFDMSQRVTFI